MNRPKLRASYDVKVLLATLNLTLCAIFSSIRIYQQRTRKSELSKLSATGLCCMLAALLQCACVVNTESWWYFGNTDRYCDISLKLCTFVYSVYRTLLYVFIILRIEVVSQSKTIRRRTIRVAKVVVGVNGTFIMASSLIFPRGVEDLGLVEVEYCTFEVPLVVLSVTVLADLVICVLGTWMFIRPLRATLSSIEDENLRQLLRWTTIWSTVSLMSTVIAFLIAVALDGAAGFVGFDCSITSFCLLMMLSPEKNVFWRENSCEIEMGDHHTEKVDVELSQIDQELSKQSEAQLSDARMDSEIKAVLDESDGSCKYWSSGPEYQSASKHSPKITVK